MTGPRVKIHELTEGDLPFLFGLWHTAEIMRYADEFPKLRGWSKSHDSAAAWKIYQQKRAISGSAYTQFILKLADGTAVGESFFTLLPEGYTFGKWQKPENVMCLIGDIKLKSAFWGQGLGTEGMRRVVAWLFANTGCAKLIVPPHRENPAAERVYEKAGFVLFTGMKSWYGHKVMDLSRARFEILGPEYAPAG